MSIAAARALELMEGPRMRSDGPRLWHHVPGPESIGPLDPRVVFTGAAVARAGIDSVWMRVDGGRPVRARHGRPNARVAGIYPDEYGPGSGDWALAVHVGGWPAGKHEIETLAVTLAGGAAVAVRHYHVDLQSAYGNWLSSRLAHPPAGMADRSVCAAVLLLADGDSAPLHLDAMLRAGSCQWHAALVGDCERRLSRSSEWERLPAERLLDGGGIHGLDDGLRAAEARGCTHVVLLRAGDRLQAGALDALTGCGDADLVYCDDDQIATDGSRIKPRFKPQWSPRLLLAHDYIGPCFAVRTSALRRARTLGGKPFTCTYDVLLRLMESGASVVHVPDVLCSRASLPPLAPPESEAEAIRGYARRRGETVAIEPGGSPEARRLRWALTARPLVSIVMPTAGSAPLLGPCLRSVAARTSYENLEVVVVDTSAGTSPIADLRPEGLACRVIPCAQPFNFSIVSNIGALAARGETLVFLNDDTEVLTPDWIERMLEQLQRPGVGVVGAKLLYPEGLVQHAGVYFAKGGPSHVGLLLAEDESGPDDVFALPRDCAAVTGACLMVSREAFEQLGGFDESIAVEYGDVDLCLRAGAQGLGVVYTPDAVLTHHESVTRGEVPQPFDRAAFRGRWPAAMRGAERYFPRVPMRP